MKKENKTISISFDVIGGEVKNTKVEGQLGDLMAALCMGNPDLQAVALTAALKMYLASDGREKWLAQFLANAAHADEQVIPMIAKHQKNGSTAS